MKEISLEMSTFAADLVITKTRTIMKIKNAITKKSSLLTLLLSVFFAFSFTSCGEKALVVEDVNLVGTTWTGFVTTRDIDGKLVKAPVSISFLQERGRWYFDADPTPFVSAWERKYENLFDNRFTYFTYERKGSSLMELSKFDMSYTFLRGSWIINRLTNKDLSLAIRAEEESRAIWLQLSRKPINPTN